jgi:hypothetical protein
MQVIALIPIVFMVKVGVQSCVIHSDITNVLPKIAAAFSARLCVGFDCRNLMLLCAILTNDIIICYSASLWCSLDVTSVNRGALITFNSVVKTQIELREWSQEEWFGEIDRVRGDSSICCKCCTPTAGRFILAKFN